MKGKHNILKFEDGEFQICEDEVVLFLPASASYQQQQKQQISGYNITIK